jgi:hypothetical protein
MNTDILVLVVSAAVLACIGVLLVTMQAPAAEETVVSWCDVEQLYDACQEHLEGYECLDYEQAVCLPDPCEFLLNTQI